MQDGQDNSKHIAYVLVGKLFWLCSLDLQARICLRGNQDHHIWIYTGQSAEQANHIC